MTHIQTTIDSLIERNENLIDIINNYNGPLLDMMDEGQVGKGVIYEHLKDTERLQPLTHFTPTHLQNIYQMMQPHLVAARTRGPKPKSTPMDMLVCYLVWLVTGDDQDTLSKILGMKTNRFEDNITRIRPILNAALKVKWWDNRPRPVPLVNTSFPHTALLIDGHSMEVFRPKG